MKLYIRSTASIIPLQAAEPDYAALIDARSIRRMSRIVKMGVAAALQCLRRAGVDMPDAIVTGTAYGCLEDTGVFLTQLIREREEALSPTAFIQSTHNTVGAQIALLLQCTGYNNTFVQGGASFESALLDAMMLLRDGEAGNVLVGGVDEMTAISQAILSRLGLYRHGDVAGEGAAFFLLSATPGEGDAIALEALDSFYKPAGPAELEKRIDELLSRLSLGREDVDLVLMGREFKKQCGEYPTATAYGLAAAVGLLKSQGHKRILVCNSYLNTYHSLILVSRC